MSRLGIHREETERQRRARRVLDGRGVWMLMRDLEVVLGGMKRARLGLGARPNTSASARTIELRRSRPRPRGMKRPRSPPPAALVEVLEGGGTDGPTGMIEKVCLISSLGGVGRPQPLDSELAHRSAV